MEDNTKNNYVPLKGGEFVVKEATIDTSFIPEEFDEEQRMMKGMIEDFIQTKFYPVMSKVERQEEGVTVGLMDNMGELGLLGAHMPEEYGGMDLDTNTNTLIAEALAPARSFIVSFAAHTGIGMLPILYFGSEELKQRYLPKLIRGTLKAAYCLTEPGSGSDALAAKTKAILSEDGTHYLITGQKIFITNAGFADIFIVFAKIDGEKFTGFVVESHWEGVSLGDEEDKLGIKGSSTRPVFFESVKVPKENVLGKIGKGHKIAFNALNIGRFKLGVMCMGGSKALIDTSVKYANERKQFGKSISSFGAIKYKLAEQCIRNFAVESSIYRVSNLMQLKIEELLAAGKDKTRAKLLAAEEYAIECAITKVAGSEVLDYIVDEAVQIHGGYGYIEEYTVAGAYRDARINRIFEGTNEINRLLMVQMLFKRAMKGSFNMIDPAWAVQKELSSLPQLESLDGYLAQEQKALKDFKKIFLMAMGGAVKQQMDGQLNLEEEQEILMCGADMMIDIFLAESTLLRVLKLKEMETSNDQTLYEHILKSFFYEANHRIAKSARDAVAYYASGDLLRVFNMGVQRFSQYPAFDVKTSRRAIADALIKANANIFA